MLLTLYSPLQGDEGAAMMLSLEMLNRGYLSILTLAVFVELATEISTSVVLGARTSLLHKYIRVR